MQTKDTIIRDIQSAAGYDLQARETHWFGPEVVFGLAYEFVKPGDTVLDLGIGSGLSSILFHHVVSVAVLNSFRDLNWSFEETARIVREKIFLSRLASSGKSGNRLVRLVYRLVTLFRAGSEHAFCVRGLCCVGTRFLARAQNDKFLWIFSQETRHPQATCHPERSEGSLSRVNEILRCQVLCFEILRFAQDDRIVSYVASFS